MVLIFFLKKKLQITKLEISHCENLKHPMIGFKGAGCILCITGVAKATYIKAERILIIHIRLIWLDINTQPFLFLHLNQVQFLEGHENSNQRSFNNLDTHGIGCTVMDLHMASIDRCWQNGSD